ncbi:MAG: hypothetical protein FJ303_04835 [Planctomycetes bacterium]|nr:hypothetical protein [Planctomycetota bacterium]
MVVRETAERGEWFRNMWLSDRDFLHLMERCLVAELPSRFMIVNGMSANTQDALGRDAQRAIGTSAAFLPSRSSRPGNEQPER